MLRPCEKSDTYLYNYECIPFHIQLSLSVQYNCLKKELFYKKAVYIHIHVYVTLSHVLENQFFSIILAYNLHIFP